MSAAVSKKAGVNSELEDFSMTGKKLVISATLVFAAAFPYQAGASTVSYSFLGPGVSGTVQLTYGSSTDSKYPGQAYEITGISGTFSDSNNGLNIVNAAVGPLEAINFATPESTNLLAPNDFSKFTVAAGTAHGALTYDNLYWPGGSPQTASSYPPHGGILDIYGLLFDIGGGKVVDLWSAGQTGPDPINYGVAVATSATALDYVSTGVVVSPEPATVALLGGGLLGLLAWRRRAS